MLDDATTLASGQRADTRDAGAVVRVHQEELLRAAYLLTGDQERAATLAESACLAQLRLLLHADDDQDWRAQLLQALAACYLAEPPAAERQPRRAVDQARFTVDDERDRVWAALDLCDPPQRLALVLRDYCRLDEGIVTELTGWPPYQLRERLNAARERVRAAAGARPEQSAQGVLLALSLGVPRVDLWAALADKVREIAEAEDRRRQLLTWGALGAVTLLVLLGALWLADIRLRSGGDDVARVAVAGLTATPRATATPLPTATTTLPLISRPAVTVPDRHIIQYSYPVGESSHSETRFFDPASGEWSEPQDFGQFGNVNISPDGQWLVDVWTEDLGEGEFEQTLMVREAVTGEVVWERVTPPDVWLQPRRFADRIIAFERDREGTGFEVPRLTAYNLANGDRLGTWEIDVPETVDDGPAEAAQELFQTLDGEQLILVLEQRNALTSAGRRTIITYRFADMEVESEVAVEIEPDERGVPLLFSIWGARMTPDGEALYQHQNWEGQVRVQFMDLATGELSTVEIPLTAPQASDGAFTVSTSYDGLRLFVISNTGEVAVFDLARRRVERIFQLDTGGHRFPAKDGLVGMWNSTAAYFAPDGSRLYLLDTWNAQSDELTPDTTSTLWVIDVARWRISERWEVPGISTSLVLNADGSRAFVGSRVPPESPDTGMDWGSRIYAVDTSSGDVRRLDEQLGLPEARNWMMITTLQQAYYQSYGVMPAAGGVTPQDLTEFSTLPLLELSTGEEVVAAGQQVRLALRFLDPTTQQPLDGATPDVRFDPGASVMLTLSHADVPDIIVVPLKVDAALWEGALPLDVNGSWSASVQVSYTDGTRWSASWPAVVDVAPSYLGSDGERYAFRLSTTPAEPAVDEPALMRVVISNIEHGGPLPEGVEIEHGLPERVNVLLMGNAGIKNVTLQPTGHGVYADETTFLWAGRWQAELSIDQPELEGLPTKVNAGVLDVGY